MPVTLSENDVFRALNNDETSRNECEMTGVKGFRIIYTRIRTRAYRDIYVINSDMRSKCELHTRNISIS